MPTLRNIDNTLRLRIGLTHQHLEIHKGKSFTCIKEDESLGDGGQIQFCFQAPPSGEFHMTFGYTAKTAAHVVLYEGATWSGGQTGTKVPVYNRNRQTGISSTILNDWSGAAFTGDNNVKNGVSGLSGGNAIAQRWNFAARAQMSTMDRGVQEIILQTGVKYALVLEADAASSAGYLEMNWYED